MRARCATVVLFAVLLAATTARADEDEAPLEVSLEPWAAFDGVERPFRYILTVRPRGGDPVEVVADRRLLELRVRPAEGRGRRYRCRHPRRPRRPDGDRVRTLRRGDPDGGVWREWIDLRMYCWGRALSVLRDGARVEGRLGWRRRSRRRWVARAPESSWRGWTGGVDLMDFTFLGVAEEPTRRVDAGAAPAAEEGEAPAPPIEVDLSRRSVRSARWLTLRPSVRAAEGRERVYVRPDAWSFRVEGPTGRAVCRIRPGGGTPPPDLFRTITERRPARELLDADYMCPAGTFDRAGVYEVVPKLRLDHGGEAWGFDAVTGRFVGPATPIRITGGDEGYVEQIPEEGDGEAEEGEASLH